MGNTDIVQFAFRHAADDDIGLWCHAMPSVITITTGGDSCYLGAVGSFIVIGGKRLNGLLAFKACTRQLDAVDDCCLASVVERHINRFYTGVALIVPKVDMVEIKTAIDDPDDNSPACIGHIKADTLLNRINT